ncbi:MAG: transcription-repair coupling factor [Myxococcales bacterium]|nr:transcription-repair coupling factor [Myxococcales bacterium]
MEETAGSEQIHEDLDDVARRIAERSGAVRLAGLRGGAAAVVGAKLVAQLGDAPALFVTPNAKACDALVRDLCAALGEPTEGGRVRAYPGHDTHPYERFSPQPFLVAQRMDVLYRWLASAQSDARVEPAPIAVAPWTALALRVPAREVVRSRSVHLEVGQITDRDALVATLVAAGYSRMSLVEERGELAVRGGILDIFPPHRAHPIRIELLGDEVESIREFDEVTQRSRDALSHVVAPPPRELLVNRSLIVDRSEQIRELAAEQGVSNRAVDALLDSLLRGHIPPGAEALAPLLQRAIEPVFDFLPGDTLIAILDWEAGRDRMRRYASDAKENYEIARENGRVVSEPNELALSPEELEREILARKPIFLERLDVVDVEAEGEHLSLRCTSHDTLRRELIKARSSDRALEPLVDALANWCDAAWRTALCVSSLSGAERLRHLLSEYGLEVRIAESPRPASRWSSPGCIEIRVCDFSEGFVFPAERLVALTEEEIFGPRQRRRVRAHWPDGASIEGLAQLEKGDYLVHVEHGIGIYRGLVELDLGIARGEFLRLEYQGGDRLFVPVHRLSLIQRYGGSDGHTPRIDKLGGVSWEKAKNSIKKSLRAMAHELLATHAARELAPGHAFAGRDRHLEEFEATFPFEETADQAAAIEDVLSDLQRPKPADRIVCGDVGYGKTEVAVRAAFRVAMDGKQVAVLVPTTVLCQQHEETFKERFAGHPIEIESLSRFRSAKDARSVIERLADGTIDIVIGTHRLLQKKVRFRDLGLLVIDEEHRFGVTHKERIKQLKKTVDVLTLTATPIPRTLQMAFNGIRDLSVINTPPADRLAIRTQVCRLSDSLIREVILREVRRGGQVFFVHNRVRTIDAMQSRLARVVPEAKVIVAHGQMKERELEDRMLRFMHGEADVLLCTTIIESGIDNPRANTILINRADTLGLAQIYQLRGRVGRSKQRAYAYLMIPGSEDALTSDARRRLEAIQDLSELGSGFRLANMDLEIRGAGNLLGPEQSGCLAAVGYETYLTMLEEIMDELRGKSHETEIDPEIRLPVTARLPESYVSATSQRLVLYKRLASCRDDSEIDRIRDELLDRYGSLPDEAENLFEVIRLKTRARRLGITAIDLTNGEIVLTAAEPSKVDPQRLLDLLHQAGAGMRIAPDRKIYARAPEGGSARLFAATLNLLANLGAA